MVNSVPDQLSGNPKYITETVGVVVPRPVLRQSWLSPVIRIVQTPGAIRREYELFRPQRVPKLNLGGLRNVTVIASARSASIGEDVQMHDGAATDRPVRSVGVVLDENPQKNQEKEPPLPSQYLRSIPRPLPVLDHSVSDQIVRNMHLPLPPMQAERTPGPLPTTFECSMKCALFDRGLKKPHHQASTENIQAHTHEPAHRPQDEDRGVVLVSSQHSFTYGPVLVHLQAHAQRRARGKKEKEEGGDVQNEPSLRARPKEQKYNSHEGYVSERRKRHLMRLTQQAHEDAMAKWGGRGGDDFSKYQSMWNEIDKDEEVVMGMMRMRTIPFKASRDDAEVVRRKAVFLRDEWIRKADYSRKMCERAEKIRKRERAQKRREEVSAEMERVRLEQAAEERRRLLRRLCQLVFKSLCTHPETGQVVDPKDLFRALDVDKSGTVDRDEFAYGLSMCKCHLEPDEMDLIWSSLDEDDGESDGQVDYNVLVAKLQRANEEAIRTSRPPVKAVLRAHTDASLGVLNRKVERENNKKHFTRALPLGPHPMMHSGKNAPNISSLGSRKTSSSSVLSAGSVESSHVMKGTLQIDMSVLPTNVGSAAKAGRSPRGGDVSKDLRIKVERTSSHRREHQQSLESVGEDMELLEQIQPGARNEFV